MSVICEAFHCTPSQAIKEDYPLVMAVLDYRTAIAARDAFNSKDRQAGFELLSENPQLPAMLSKLHRAQVGLPLEVPEKRAQQEGMRIAEAHRPEDEEED